MAVTNNIISFWKKVREKSSDMFTLFKIGIGVKSPTHKLHVKDKTNPIKVEGMVSKNLTGTDVASYNILQADSNGVFYKTDHEGGICVTKLFDKNGVEYFASAGEGESITGGNLIVAGDLTVSGNDIKFEGTTADEFETTLTAADTTGSDKTLTLPNLTGTIATTGVEGGGTGATTFTSNAVLTGNGTSAIQAESGLTYDSEDLTIGDDDNGSASIKRKDHGDGVGGNLQIFAGSGGAADSAGGDLKFYAGYGKGSGGGGQFQFISNLSDGASSAAMGSLNVAATLTKTGNLTIDGGLTTGSTSAINSSGLIQVANQSNITGVGTITSGVWNGTAIAVANGGTGATTFTSGQILRGNGTSALTADTNLKFDGSNFTIISSTSARPQLLISNTNSDAEAPSLVFDRTSTTGADGDDIGVIKFDAEDAVGNGPHTYAQILGEIQEADDGSEEGKLTLSVASHDAESQPGLIIASGNAEDEVDVTVGNGATSVTTIAGTLTMGSTAAMTNAGLLSVGNQSNITGVGTINSGVWQGTAIASAYLDADTAHLTTTQTFTGAKTFEEKVTLDGDKNITPSDDGVALHVDSGDITDTNTSASGTVNAFFYTTIENPRLLATNSSVTTTTAATLHVKGAPVAHTNQTITNAYSLYVGGGTSYFNGDVSVSDLTVRGNDIKDDDGTTCITFDSSGNTSIAGTLSCADLDITGATNALTVNPQTGNVAINCISTDADCMVRVQDNSTAGTNAMGMVSTGDDLVMRNDEGNFKVKVANNATDALTVDQSGNLNVTGIITGKQRQIYQQSFIDDLGTTKHYLPWRDTDEQTTIYQEEAAMIAPYDGRIVSVTMRMSSIAYTGNRTIGIHTIGPNGSQFSTGSWTEEETESNAISNSDDNHVFYFVFDNAKHFESGELVVLSIQDDADLHSGSRYCYVSTVVEWDYNNGLGTGASSAEYDSAQ